MKACSVPISAVKAMYYRLDSQPYIDATKQLPALFAEAEKRIMATTQRATRQALGRLHATLQFRLKHDLHKVEVLK